MVQLSLCISSPFTRCFFLMYCLHIVAKGVRKERRCKGHDASKFPVSRRFFWLIDGPVGIFPSSSDFLFLFCSWVTLSTLKEIFIYKNASPFFYPSFFFLSFHYIFLEPSVLQYLLVTFLNPVLTRCYQGRKITSHPQVAERFGCSWFRVLPAIQ